MTRSEISELMSKWARKGGRAKAKNRTPEQRSEEMRVVANARWAKIRAEKAAQESGA